MEAMGIATKFTVRIDIRDPLGDIPIADRLLTRSYQRIPRMMEELSFVRAPCWMIGGRKPRETPNVGDHLLG
jgi:hypothetical protein